MSYGLVSTCQIAFSINLLVFSCAVVHAQGILLRSLDTLSMKFHSSCVIMLNCCKTTIDCSWGCTSWLWCELFVFWLTNGILLYMGCLWLSLICPSWACNNVNLVIVVNALISNSSAGGNGTTWADWLSHCVSLWLLKIHLHGFCTTGASVM